LEGYKEVEFSHVEEFLEYSHPPVLTSNRINTFPPRLIPHLTTYLSTMTAHKDLTSKADFDAALATKGKYVLIYAYTGEVNPKAEGAAEKHAANTDAFKVDVDKYPTAKEFFGITTTPTVIVYKDGKELKKVEGIDEEKAKEIASVLV